MKTTKKNIVLVIFFYLLTISTFVFPQTNISKEQKTYIDSLNKLAYRLIYSNVDSSIILANQVKKLSKTYNYIEGLGFAYLTMGTAYYSASKKDSAKLLLEKSENLLKKGKKSKALATLYIMQGIYYIESLDFPKASEKFHNASEISTELNDSSGIATAYIDISYLYVQLGDYNQGLDYIILAYEISKKIGNIYLTQHSLLNIAEIYLKSKKYKKSFKYLTKAKNLKNDGKDKETLATISLFFSKVYFEMGKYDSALTYINHTLKQYQAIGNKSTIFSAAVTKIKIHEKLKQYQKVIYFTDKLLDTYKDNNNTASYAQIVYLRGKALFSLNKYSEAKKCLHSVLSLPRSNENLNTFRDTHLLLYKIAEIEHNPKEAFKQFKKYASFRDSVNVLETKIKSTDFEKLRELKLKEKEIENLKKDKIIANLKLESQTTYRNFLFLISILLGIIFIVVTINNIKIRAFNKKLKQLHESEERFLKIISHDIKNSLGAVINFSNLLINNKNSLTKDERKESIAEINKAALATNNLLTNLLQWTLAKKNDISFKPKNENLKKLISEGIASSLSLIKIKELELIINIDDNIEVYVDHYSITSVIRNLLTNAIKFSKPKGKLIFDAEIKDKFVYVSLKDNGIGMSSETLKNLFNENIHSTKKGTNNEQGTGIGISLIQKFVEMNGGTIKAESQLGKGSTFTFSIPLTNKN